MAFDLDKLQKITQSGVKQKEITKKIKKNKTKEELNSIILNFNKLLYTEEFEDRLQLILEAYANKGFTTHKFHFELENIHSSGLTGYNLRLYVDNNPIVESFTHIKTNVNDIEYLVDSSVNCIKTKFEVLRLFVDITDDNILEEHHTDNSFYRVRGTISF